MSDNEYIDILTRIQQALVSDGLTKDVREVLLESMNEIESLRNVLKMFSDEFENIQRQDQAMGLGQFSPQ